MANVNVVLSLN